MAKRRIIDSHIHIDQYSEAACKKIITGMNDAQVEALIAVSMNAKSARHNLKIAQQHPNIFPAIGYHPEQDIPSIEEIEELCNMIVEEQHEIVAIGEIGLPYYLRQKNPTMELQPYIEMLEIFIEAAASLNKPVVLHAIYDDAPIVCDLLEKHSIKKAHFHWFKGDQKTIQRMIKNNYYISVTLDVLYEKEIQQLVDMYPLSLMMVETDGPWEFVGPFANKMTHPNMIHQAIGKIAYIKNKNLATVYEKIYENTTSFYKIS